MASNACKNALADEGRHHGKARISRLMKRVGLALNIPSAIDVQLWADTTIL